VTGAVETVNAIAKAGEVVPFGVRSLPDAEQLELLRGADGVIPRASIAQVRRAGRPKGAKNVRSKKIADFYVGRFGDPLVALGELANTPLRQLIEVLIEAEGGEEREERLLAAVDEAVDAIKSLRTLGGGGDQAHRSDMADKLADAIDKLAAAAARLDAGKPGKLALDALALQIAAHKTALEYVHGKQPIAIDLRKQADVVIVASEILKEYDIDADQLAAHIAANGLEGLDPETLRIGGPVDAEFTEVEPEGSPE
jgi:hypothetical protein